MNTAFIVVGAESSATRMMTSLLIASGCHGCAEHSQPFDTEPFTGEHVVWRRSYPHGGGPQRHWPSLRAMIARVEREGYWPMVVVTVRDWSATARSQVNHGHVDSLDAAYYNIPEAYRRIFGELTAPYVMGVYGSLISSTEARRNLVESLGLTFTDIEVRNENEKHFR